MAISASFMLIMPICLAYFLLSLGYPFLNKGPIHEQPEKLFTVRRIIIGLSGSSAAMIVSNLIVAFVSELISPSSQTTNLFTHTIEAGLYLNMLQTPFVVSGLLLAYLPLLYLLSRLRLASLSTSIVLVFLSAIAIPSWFMAFTSSAMCTPFSFLCMSEHAGIALLAAAPPVVGFALAARLPWKRNPELNIKKPAR